MIIFDGQKLDLRNPKTEVEKLVAGQFKDIVKNYGLDKGKRIHFVYPKKYIIPNPHDPFKEYKPRSFRIKYQSTLQTPAGTETWVYANTIGRDKNGAPKYNPRSRIFQGSMYLGINDIDEIFYLLYKYPRTEGGKVSSKLSKFIAIHDVDVEAQEDVSENKGRILIESALYLGEESGGLSAEKVVKLAQHLRFPNYESKSDTLLRKELKMFLTSMQGGAEVLAEFISKGKPKAKEKVSDEFQEIINPSSPYAELAKAETDGIIGFYNVGGNLGWRWLRNGKPAGKIMSVTSIDTRYQELQDFISENEDVRIKYEEFVG